MARSATRPRSRTRTPPTKREPPLDWAGMYASTPYTRLPWYSARPAPWVVRAVRDRWIEPPGPILDVGCGAGTNAIWLASSGFQATGIDLAPVAVGVAQRRAGRTGSRATFRVANVLSLPFRAASFAGVIDCGCFHTLPFDQRARYATELGRVVRPGGVVLITWIAREETGEYGPPHRPSVHEVTGALEPLFVFEHTEFADASSKRAWSARGHTLARYSARLTRRRSPQPTRR